MSETLAMENSAEPRFNASVLHELLHAIPAGTWTTYDDLAAVTDLPTGWLESHIGSCSECPNTWRILTLSGEASPGYTATDAADTRSQAEMLAGEGAPFTGGRADPERRIAPIQLPYFASLSFDYPTIEYVKEPVELTTGKRSGQRIRMRHFSDCTHWYREEDNPGQMIGVPPRRATDEEMRTVPGCGSCVTRARKHHNPVRG